MQFSLEISKPYVKISLASLFTCADVLEQLEDSNGDVSSGRRTHIQTHTRAHKGTLRYTHTSSSTPGLPSPNFPVLHIVDEVDEIA